MIACSFLCNRDEQRRSGGDRQQGAEVEVEVEVKSGGVDVSRSTEAGPALVIRAALSCHKVARESFISTFIPR